MRALASLLALATLLPSLPSAHAAPTTAGEAIVGFATDAMPELGPGDDLLGLTVTQASAQGHFLVVAASDLDDATALLAGLPGVTYVEDNGRMDAVGAVPNDPKYAQQWGPPMMGFPAAWDAVGHGSSSITVAVIDSGVLRTHADFTAARILPGHDYARGDSDPNDECGHGTHVTGTIAASTDNGVGVAGMSQATILPLKALAGSASSCSGSNANVAQAIYDAADQGARIISMSLGSPSSDTTTRNAVAYAIAHNVTVVAAAGNDGKADSVGYPAAYPGVIAVSALDSDGSLASYSSYGPQVAVAAPGSDIVSTYKDGGYATMSGTSMATPHVAGALALALGCAPRTSNTDLKAALQATAQDLGAAGRDDKYGSGLARADRLVARLCPGAGNGTAPAPVNQAPTAVLHATTSALKAYVDATASADPDGDALTYAWSYGDGARSTTAKTSHSYKQPGSYNVTLRVDDGHGHNATSIRRLSVTADPDPATANLENATSKSIVVNATVTDAYAKVQVPNGAGRLVVTMTGPSCTSSSCAAEADLSVRLGSKPTDSTYDCKSANHGNTESCLLSAPAAGWYYVRVHEVHGAGTMHVKATFS